MPDFTPVDTTRIQYIAVALTLGLIAVIVELIRRGRLREEYALIWLASAVVFLFFSIFRGAFDAIAHAMGIAYGPALIILGIALFGFVMLVHFSIVISRLTSENKRLAQEVALLGDRLRSGDTSDQ